MVLIGMLHHRKNPEKVKKSYAYAVVAKAEGANFIYFSPKGVNFKKQKITGFIYQDGKWVQVESCFPDVIYNAGSPVKLNKSKEIITKLKKNIPFTTHSIGNKISVYDRLKEDGTFSDYLIPTYTIFTLQEFNKYLKKYRKVVFKPVNGHKGQNISFVEPIDYKRYRIKNEEKDTELYEFELLDEIKKMMKDTRYLVQPFIKSRTKSGNAYDFRIHTQKDGEGKWVITAIYPRIGPPGSMVSNISSGGATNYLEPFLKQEFGEKYYDIKQILYEFGKKLSLKMDELEYQHFNVRIDELGIDVGLDENNKIWIFEVNWRPGCPPTFYLELDVVKNTIHYAMYLAKRHKGLEV